jgi:hypothetical protein
MKAAIRKMDDDVVFISVANVPSRAEAAGAR